MHDSSPIEKYSKLVAGTTINETTLLATDYLNHFNEVVMILDLLTEMPDMIVEAQEWKPKSYQAHFADSVFPYRDLAIAAFEDAPAEVRALFDPLIESLNEMVIASVAKIAAAVESGDSVRLEHLVQTASRKLHNSISRASAIINGKITAVDSTQTDVIMDQTSIDSLFD